MPQRMRPTLATVEQMGVLFNDCSTEFMASPEMPAGEEKIVKAGT